jgi:RNase P protein component
VAAPRALGSLAQRNRQRRRLRAIARALDLPRDFDWILAGTSEIAEAPWNELLNEATGLVQELSARLAEPSGCS